MTVSSSSSRVSSVLPVKAGKDCDTSAVKHQTSLCRPSILPNRAFLPPALLSFLSGGCRHPEFKVLKHHPDNNIRLNLLPPNRMGHQQSESSSTVVVTVLLLSPPILISSTTPHPPYWLLLLTFECGCFLGFLLKPSSTLSSWQSHAPPAAPATFFLATPRSIWDLSSPTRDPTRGPCNGSVES